MRLPNAPLVEVVFELRWEAVENFANAQPPFGFDPGLHSLVMAFDAELPGLGFVEQEYLGAGPSVLYSVVKRYRQKRDLFPLVQLGHGLVAINVSTGYEWDSFRDLCGQILKLVDQHYPKIGKWGLNPVAAELRYIDVFNSELGSVDSFSNFVNAAFNATIEIPAFRSSRFKDEEVGRLSLARSLVSDPSTKISLDVHSGMAGATEGIVMTTKVVKTIENDEWRSDFKAKYKDWMETAHSITSPLFSEIVHNNLMQRFR